MRFVPAVILLAAIAAPARCPERCPDGPPGLPRRLPEPLLRHSTRERAGDRLLPRAPGPVVRRLRPGAEGGTPCRQPRRLNHTLVSHQMRHAPTRSRDSPDDVALMTRVVARDQAAFRQLAERHAGRIIAVAQRILGNAAEADEIAQETLFRLWQQADRWDPQRAELRVWLYRIVCNLCIDRTRRRIFRPLDAAD